LSLHRAFAELNSRKCTDSRIILSINDKNNYYKSNKTNYNFALKFRMYAHYIYIYKARNCIMSFVNKL